MHFLLLCFFFFSHCQRLSMPNTKQRKQEKHTLVRTAVPLRCKSAMSTGRRLVTNNKSLPKRGGHSQKNIRTIRASIRTERPKVGPCANCRTRGRKSKNNIKPSRCCVNSSLVVPQNSGILLCYSAPLAGCLETHQDAFTSDMYCSVRGLLLGFLEWQLL